MRTMFFTAGILLATMLWAKASNDDTPDVCSLDNATFTYGEDVTYKVYYNWKAVWIGAGTVDFTVDKAKIDNKDMYHVKAYGKTFRTYDLFYKVRDTYETYLDVNTLNPRRFVREVNEGGFEIYNKYDMDHNNGYLAASRSDTKKPDLRTDTFQIGTCTQDILSAIYQARLIDFHNYSVGSKIPFDIFIDDQIYHMQVDYLGQETIEVDGDKWNCIKFSPQLLKGEYFADEVGMTVWVTNDKNKMPVLIESPLTVGSVKAVVKNYKGLKHPVTAKLN